jgi:hypothetical protein
MFELFFFFIIVSLLLSDVSFFKVLTGLGIFWLFMLSTAFLFIYAMYEMFVAPFF